MKYFRDSGIRNHILMVTAIVICLTLIQAILPVSAEDNITVRCYLGNRSVGNVTVFDTSTAAAACNSVYRGCKGQCIGCFHDFDFVDYVCVDMAGHTFLR
jgi:hypothetical protein